MSGPRPSVALKRHPLDHYVPLLLSGLQSPIEASMQCMLGAAGDLITSYSVFQEAHWPTYRPR